MNFRFWKKKTVTVNDDEDVTRETVAADETSPKPVKAGWFARLKTALKPSRKKGDSDIGDEPETRAEHTGGGHGDHEDHKPSRTGHFEEEESKPIKAGFLVRLKNVLHLSRKKGEPDEEGAHDHSSKRADKNIPETHHKKTGASARGKSRELVEEEELEQPDRKLGKKKWIILALLLLLIGGGFGAWKWLRPPPDHKAPPIAVQKQEKPEGTPAERPTDAAALTEAAEKAQAEATALAEAAAKAQAEEVARAEAAAQSKAEADAAAQAQVAAEQAAAESQAATTPPASTDTDIQAQLDALRKQNQEMQMQLEALKNQRSSVARPASGNARPPRGGVLIINGKNTKESAQGLKQVIEEMNAASGIKGEQKPPKQ